MMDYTQLVLEMTMTLKYSSHRLSHSSHLRSKTMIATMIVSNIVLKFQSKTVEVGARQILVHQVNQLNKRRQPLQMETRNQSPFLQYC
jgi:hypothetical protein